MAKTKDKPAKLEMSEEELDNLAELIALRVLKILSNQEDKKIKEKIRQSSLESIFRR